MGWRGGGVGGERGEGVRVVGRWLGAVVFLKKTRATTMAAETLSPPAFNVPKMAEEELLSAHSE